MKEIKKGVNVTRNSYNNDIIFKVKRILKLADGKTICILKGIDVRVEADSPIEDLRIVRKSEYDEYEKKFNSRMNNRILANKLEPRNERIVKYGKILHLDGDKKYSEKSLMYYQKMGLKAVVKNIPENKQPKVVYRLLQIYNPDILVITRS